MIDFRWTELSLGLALLFNVAFVLYVIVYYKRCVSQPIWQREKPGFGLILFSLLLIIFVSNSSVGDWYHYQDMVWNYDLSPGAVNHGEPIYGYIIGFINKNYMLFRIIVWGGAFLMTYWIFKRFEVNVTVAVYFIVSVFLIKYNYSRTTLSMASFFLGLSYMIKPVKRKKMRNVIFALLFFWGSYEFHHSALPLLLLSLVAFLPINKPIVMILLLLSLPSVAAIILDKFDMVEALGNAYIAGRLSGYVAQEAESSNLYGRIQNIISYGSFVLPLFITSVAIFKKESEINVSIIRLYRVMMSIVVFAVSFLFMGLSSFVFVYRYLYMTLIPITVISVYLYQNKLISKTQFSALVLWGIVANVQSLLLGVYKAL